MAVILVSSHSLCRVLGVGATILRGAEIAAEISHVHPVLLRLLTVTVLQPHHYALAPRCHLVPALLLALQADHTPRPFHPRTPHSLHQTLIPILLPLVAIIIAARHRLTECLVLPGIED